MNRGNQKIGLGTGTLASIGRGASGKTVDAIVGAAQDLGISVIDTADSYTSGRCESLLGATLRGRRNDFCLITKAGYRHGTLPAPLQLLNPYLKRVYRAMAKSQCFSPAYLARCLNRSLERLRTDRVEGFLLHDPPPEALRDPQLLAMLEDLRKAGKTKRIGISTTRRDVMQCLAGATAFTIIECPVSLLIDPELSNFWVGIDGRSESLEIVANNVFFSGTIPGSGRLPAIARHLDASSHELLMRFTASLPRAGTILVGTRNPVHLEQCVSWAREPLSRDDAAAVAEALR